MAKIALAEALLKRKELAAKVGQLAPINREGLFEPVFKRVNVTDSVDDVHGKVPKISMNQVTHAYDWHAKRLRMVDAAIQKANWETVIEVDGSIIEDYKDPYVEPKSS